MEFFAYLASALIGISLGLIGAGGSILTVPMLVYLFGVSPLLATSYSLFIVGSTSLMGAFNNYKKGFTSIRTALLFGTSSITTVFLIRKFIIPQIPQNLGRIGNFMLTEHILTMVLFALLMIAASIAMIGNSSKNMEPANVEKINFPKLLGYGFAVGLTTGFLGAGGGFLLIPTLVLLVGLSMKQAIGTSLLIISLNSLIGFTGDLGHFKIDWPFLLKITAIAIAGVFVGGSLNKRFDGQKLKKAFGWFVLIMGIYILIKELLLERLS